MSSEGARVLDSSTDFASQSDVMLENGMRLTEDARSSELQRRGEERRTMGEVASNPIYPSRTRSMVCRTSVVACAFIICVHILLVWSVDVAPTIDRIARQGASIVAPVSHQVELSRVKRHLTDENEYEAATEDEEELKKSKLSQERKEDESESFSSSSSSSSICRSGHIQGLGAICTDSHPCLRRLHRPNTQSPHPSPSSAADHVTSSAQILRRISRISGRLDAVHLSLVPFLSEFQWKNGVYGSVGEFGVSLGKFTALLSTYTDIDAGERLFVCDCFNRSTSGEPGSTSGGSAGHHGTVVGLTQFQVFTTHMRDFGFEVEDGSAGSSRRLHLIRGSSSTIDPLLFSTWDLPQFRLISIDADLDSLSVLYDLETASCLLRDGGLIIVNGVDDHDTRQLTTWTMVNYFRKHGQSALTPIISTGNKLYLTTTNWRRKYMEALSNDVILTQSGLIQSAFIASLTNDLNSQTSSDVL